MTTNDKHIAIAKEKFEEVLKQLGVTWTAQSGYHKVDGPTGRRLYVANGKTTSRVDLSGFTSEFGTRAHRQGTFGNVKEELDMRAPLGEEDILRNFASLVEYMMALPPVEPKAKKAKAAKAPKPAGEEVKTENVLPDTEDAKKARAARLDKIKAAAEAMGVPVSQKTLDESAELASTPAES